MGAHRAETSSRTRSRVGGTLLLLGASLAVASPSAFAMPGSHGSADGGTVTGGSGGSATSSNSDGGDAGDGGNGGRGGQGGDYTEETSPSSSTGALGTSLLGTTTGSPYANCTEARAAGRENIPRSAPDYAPSLDGDNDGIACENPPNGRS